MNYWLLSILVLCSYLIGSISFGRILAKSKNIDITQKGSGNPGATNMFRNVGAGIGFLTLFLDALKGFISALVGYIVFGMNTIEGLIGLYSCGLGAVVGHMFPLYYKLKGGKSAATMIGVFLVAQPIPMVICFVVAFVYVWFFKYVSVASMLIVTAMVIYQNLTMPEPDLTISLLTFAIFLLIWFAHRSNIERLLKGKETETNIKKKIFKDKKKQQKIEEKQEDKAIKIELKFEKKEEKAEIKEAKHEIKREKKNIKKIRKSVLKTKKPRKKLKVFKLLKRKKQKDIEN